jgi:hypothetical protein
MVVEEAEFNFNTTYITSDVLSYSNATLPMVIDWTIGNMTCDIAQTNKSSYACRSDHSVCLHSTSGHGGYLCNCSRGYQGNPYLEGGCQGIFLSHCRALALFMFFFYNMCGGCHVNYLA